jgi:hypothetical protein
MKPFFRSTPEFCQNLLSTLDLERYPLFSQFLRENISRYSIDVYEGTGPRSEEKRFETLLSETQAKLIFCAESDFKGHCLHVMGHGFLFELWRDLRLAKNIFLEHELDFIEDIFIQAFVAQIAPSLYMVYPAHYQRIREGKDWPEAQSLLKESSETSLKPMNMIHKWLYETEDILNKKVFEKYCFLISEVKNCGQFQAFLG